MRYCMQCLLCYMLCIYSCVHGKPILLDTASATVTAHATVGNLQAELSHTLPDKLRLAPRT